METFDHIIVGGGIIGASTAYHLKRKRAGSVLLLERNDLASAATSRAAGLVLQASTKYSKTPLAKMTTRVVPALEAETGESVEFHNVGSLRIAATNERAAELDAMVEDALNWEIPVEFPGDSEIRELVPWLEVSRIMKSAYFPTDGYVDPYLMGMSYVKAARSLGAVVRPYSNVEDILTEQEKVIGVLSNNERIACSTVVDACGAWASVFSARAGFALPMAPVRSHYWITEPSSVYGGEHPVTILPDVAAYTRPEVGGLVLGLQEPRSTTFDARDLPHDPAAFSPTQGEEHWDILADAYAGLSQFFPAIENARFSNYICGLSSYTPDGEIILGPVPGVAGFYAAAGACGSGITLSAGMGDAISDLVLEQEPAFDISRFRPDRFGDVDPFGESFRERCAMARASKTLSAVSYLYSSTALGKKPG